MSLFITIEGGDGCGKTTQADILYKKLIASNFSAIRIAEPGGTPLGDELRNLLKRKWNGNIAAESELLLFNASRKQLVAEVILPALKKDITVVCDRFSDSTVAYQGYGRGLDLSTTETINRFATGGIKPDLTILLDMPVSEALGRKQGKEDDRFDSDDIAFHDRIRQGFLALARKEAKRWVVINATQSVEQISTCIWEEVSRRLKR
ncbi:MAG TPA: dTMP kinase [Dehalococcoidia bacterium]|nr:dTMP kinase [Dehalococcoidia bacterium]